MDLDHDACYRAVCQRDPRFDGRFFTGVKTTGIYCRPICPARTPLSKNVTFFPTAAAAQAAGFRPCLRCRPETAPDLGAWRGTSNTVSRALALIELGALDEARRRCLGRPARRGRAATPAALPPASWRIAGRRRPDPPRAACQAADPRIAPADGRGRLRRRLRQHSPVQRDFPDAIRPRARRRCAVRAGRTSRLGRMARSASCCAIIRLTIGRPCSSFCASGQFAASSVVSADRYARSVQLDGVQGTVAVQPAAGNALRATVRFPKLSALPTIIARLRRVFDLAADPIPIAAHLAQDPALAPLVKARPGLRVPGAWDGFELAIRAVLGQQITVSAAVGLAGRLVAAHGERLAEPDGDLTHVFPPPESLAAADLASLGMPRSRAAALSAVAAAAVADTASLRRDLRARRCRPAAALDPRRRGMDGAIHRFAPAARA